MPNEIFEDLRSNIEKAQHVAFSYSYLYFISYLYRYCEYEGMTQALIKEKLGYTAKEKRLDYLIKKDGILDCIGYTQTTSNYPIRWEMDDDNIISFYTQEDYKKEYGTSSIITEKNFKVKYPVKLFHRNEESLQEGVLDGTLYDISNTHKIYYRAFEKCMQSNNLGVTAFYIYGYLRWKNDIYGDYRVASRVLATELGFSEPTLFKYMKEMEQCGLLKIIHKKFVGVGGEANLYRALIH